MLTDNGMLNEVSKLAMVCADEFQSCLLVSSRNRTLKSMVGDSLMVCVYVCFLLFVLYLWPLVSFLSFSSIYRGDNDVPPT